MHSIFAAVSPQMMECILLDLPMEELFKEILFPLALDVTVEGVPLVIAMETIVTLEIPIVLEVEVAVAAQTSRTDIEFLTVIEPLMNLPHDTTRCTTDVPLSSDTNGQFISRR